MEVGALASPGLQIGFGYRLGYQTQGGSEGLKRRPKGGLVNPHGSHPLEERHAVVQHLHKKLSDRLEYIRRVVEMRNANFSYLVRKRTRCVQPIGQLPNALCDVLGILGIHIP